MATSPARRPRDPARTSQVCTKCGIDKPLSEFGINRRLESGPVYKSACRRCLADDNYPKMRRKTFEMQYGITLEEYEERHRDQGGVCATCGRPEWVTARGGKVRLLCVDHDHVTGKVRGLLCSNCNRAVGLLNDDVDLMKKVIYYLQAGGVQ